MNILVEISPAELIDKLTILEIKLELIKDEGKRANVKREYSLLISAYQATIVETEPLRELTSTLKRINRELWDIEDNIRAEERAKSFGARFIELARSVYRTNDRRAAVKRQINAMLNSPIPEEKSYADY
ncbi:MAG: hypothetical protein E6G91_15645 [Alphaproteobacteria bacterium]|jgi:Family of unknown function (DUF6165)|nr:MAG: hypothetical protein E6G91_15645 [Alphaproteobacteria bacterium]